MPPITPLFTWRQTANKVLVSLDLHLINPKLVDIVHTTKYLKVSFPPYCFEKFLQHDTIPDDSSSHAKGGKLELVLVKQAEGEWASLGRELEGGQAAAAQERQDVVAEVQAVGQRRARVRAEERVAANRRGVAQQVVVAGLLQDGCQRVQDNITSAFFREGATTMASDEVLVAGRRRFSEEREYDGDGEDHYSSTEDIMKAMSLREPPPPSGGARKMRRLLTKKNTTGKPGSSGNRDVDDEEDEDEEDTLRRRGRRGAGGVKSEEDKEMEESSRRRGGAAGGKDGASAKKKYTQQSRTPVSPRTPRTLHVVYTSRPTPTPARASREDEDAHMLRQQQLQQQRREQQQQEAEHRKHILDREEYLKEKECDQEGEQEQPAECCQLINHEKRQHELQLSQDDSLKKLKESDNQEHLEVIQTAGRYNAEDNRTVHEEQQCEQQNNEVNTTDAAAVDAMLADARHLFARGEFIACAAVYSEVVRVRPLLATAYSNRAAAHLAARNYRAAAKDANKALSLLEDSTSSSMKSRLLCLSRRGAARAALCQLAPALADYEAALVLDPLNSQLMADRDSLQRALDTSEGSSWVETEEETG